MAVHKTTEGELSEWRELETTQDVVKDIRDYILESLVRVVDMPRELWTASLDSVRGMREVLDILEETGKKKEGRKV